MIPSQTALQPVHGQQQCLLLRRAVRSRRNSCCPRRSRTQHPPQQHGWLENTAAAAYQSQPADPTFSSKGFGLPKWLPDGQAVRLVTDAWALLYSNMWAVVMIFLAKDAAAFVLHRLAHRLTNHIAESLFGIPISSLGNPWWIMVDAKFMEGNFGYQVLVGIFFLLCLPLNILFNTAAVSTAAVVCTTRRATANRQPAVPGASFAGQGSGKVGLAQCRSSSSLDSGDYSEGSSSSSIDQAASSSSSSSSSSKMSGAAGVTVFRGPGVASFRTAVNVTTNTTAAHSNSSKPGSGTRSKSGKSSGSSSSSGGLRPPAAAPVVPWLAAKQQQRQQLPPPLGLKPSLAMVKEMWSKQVAHRIQQLWAVDLYFNLWSLPLQAACLAVLPVFWAFPRLLAIQLSLPAAVLSGAQGKDALERSKQLMAGFRNTYAWPFVWLIVGGRVLELVREVVLVAMPVRWWTDVIEVPLLGTGIFAVARILLLRMQDLLPLAAYLQRTAQAASAAKATS